LLLTELIAIEPIKRVNLVVNLCRVFIKIKKFDHIID